jgi:hypothetical protein
MSTTATIERDLTRLSDQTHLVRQNLQHISLFFKENLECTDQLIFALMHKEDELESIKSESMDVMDIIKEAEDRLDFQTNETFLKLLQLPRKEQPRAILQLQTRYLDMKSRINDVMSRLKSEINTLNQQDARYKNMDPSQSIELKELLQQLYKHRIFLESLVFGLQGETIVVPASSKVLRAEK